MPSRLLCAIVLLLTAADPARGVVAATSEVWISGRVLSVSGETIPGATIEYKSLHRYTPNNLPLPNDFTSDASGQYRIRISDWDWSSTKHVREFALIARDGAENCAVSPRIVFDSTIKDGSEYVELPNGDPTGQIRVHPLIIQNNHTDRFTMPLNLKFLPMHTVHGHVRRSDGESLSGVRGCATLDLTYDMSRTGLGGEVYERFIEIDESVSSATDVYFTVPNVVLALRHSFSVGANGMAEPHPFGVKLETVRAGKLVEVLLHPAEFATATFRIVDDNGTPIPGASVELYSYGRWNSLNGTTDETGAVSVPVGKLEFSHINVSAPTGYVSDKTIEFENPERMGSIEDLLPSDIHGFHTIVVPHLRE